MLLVAARRVEFGSLFAFRVSLATEELKMPIYEYVCNDCNSRYEKLVLSNGSRVACPKCGSKKHTLQFSTFSTAGNGSSSSTVTSSPDSAPSFSGGSCCNPGGCGCH